MGDHSKINRHGRLLDGRTWDKMPARADGGHGMTGTCHHRPAELPRLALSIRQPWAWAIIHAGKDIENRDWQTRFRGQVCIHAAKGMTRDEWDDATGFMHFDLGIVAPLQIHVERGGIIGVAEIVDCVEASESRWFFGRYGFVLRNARPVAFIPVKGALGLFDWRQNLTSPTSDQMPEVRDA